MRAPYPGLTWARLVAIKAKYDPTNLFHLNQNMPPEQVGWGPSPLDGSGHHAGDEAPV